MNLKKIITIYKKEMLDLLRDRRTVIASIVIPIILYPLIMIGFTSLTSRQELKLEEQRSLIYIHNNSSDPIADNIIQELKDNDKFSVLEISQYKSSMLQDDLIHAELAISDSINDGNYQQINVLISYNKATEKGEKALNRLLKYLRNIEKDLAATRLSQLNIDTKILDIIDIEEDNIAPPEEMLGFIVGKILPYLLIILTLSSGAVVASDLVAGEKERGTLETILVSAASRLELVLGKYFTIITFSLVTVFLNLFSMYFSFQHIISQMGVDTTNMQLPIGNFALILVAMIPLVTLLSAILLSISTFARNIKEAQSYHMPLVFGGMILAMMSMLPGFDLTYGFALIPIMNFSLLFKEIMMNNFDPISFSIVIGSTVILDIIAIVVSINLFKNESILFRTAEEKSLKFWGKNNANIFSPQFIMIYFFFILVIFFYLGGAWQKANLLSGLLKTQIFIIFLPVLLLLRLSKSNIKSALSLNKTKFLNFILVIAMAIPAVIIATLLGQVINFIFPFSDSYLKALNQIVTPDSSGILFLFLVVGLAPGICEEILCRGYILGAFKKKGFWTPIIISAILFAVLHLDPFRFLPVAILGGYLGYLVIRSNSILVSMFAHILNNSLAIAFSNYGDKIPILEKIIYKEQLSFWLGIPALIIMIAGIVFFEKINNSDKMEDHQCVV